MSESWLGKYQLLREVGSGGMGTALLARQTGPASFERLVVIKRINAEHLPSEMARTALLQEAQLTAQLRHPNIVQVFDVAEHHGIPFLVMEHINGPSLEIIRRRLASKRGRMPEQHVVTIALALCRGLHFAHTFVDDRGVAHPLVHRDVKPSNVLIDFRGSVKLIDFGLAKSLLNQGHTLTGQLKGTPPFMAPEQVKGLPADQRTDLFALGVVMYTMLSGYHPFWRGEVFSTFRAIIEDEPPPMASFHPDIGDSYQAIIERCLAKPPDDRYQSARDLQRELLALASGDEEQRQEALGRYVRELAPDALGAGPTVVEQAPTTTSDALTAPRGRPADAPTVEISQEQPQPPLRSDESTDIGLKAVTALSVADDKTVAALPPASLAGKTTWMLAATTLVLVASGILLWWATTSAPSPDRPLTQPLPRQLATRRAPPAARAARTVQLTGLDNNGLAVKATTATAADAATTELVATVNDAALRSEPLTPRHQHDSGNKYSSSKHAAPPDAHADSTGRPHKRRVAIRAGHSTRNSGALRLTSRPTATFRLGSKTATGGAYWRLHRSRGTITANGATFPLSVKLRYRIVDNQLLCTIESTPWSIAYLDDLRPGRTPRHDIPIGPQTRRIELRRPDGTEVTIVMRYDAPRGTNR